jgi:ABC-type bacteriocin/lantibiotic exporter with double-glycine peptidase domain
LALSVEEYGANLSGGQRQKVALATRPRLLLLDELTTGLDIETEKTIIERLVVLEHGQLLADGPTAKLLVG